MDITNTKKTMLMKTKGKLLMIANQKGIVLRTTNL
jgi:hypothetical protein